MVIDVNETPPKAPSIQIIPTLGPKVYTYDLLWAISGPRVPFQAAFASLWSG